MVRTAESKFVLGIMLNLILGITLNLILDKAACISTYEFAIITWITWNGFKDSLIEHMQFSLQNVIQNKK